MRDILREVQTGPDLHKPNISHNYRSNVIETLKWYCSEQHFEDLERSLVELFSTAPNCRLLECDLRSYDSEATQDTLSEILDTMPSSLNSAVSGNPHSPYSLVQFDFNGISGDGIAWAAKVHLAVKSSSDEIWKTVLHDISLTSPGTETDLLPWVDIADSASSLTGDFGSEIGMETIAREFVHEMKNPLSAIITAVGLIETDTSAGNTSENAEMLGIIEENATRMVTMLTDFILASCNPELTRSKQDLTGMIAEIVDELQKNNDTLSVKLAGNTQAVLAEVDKDMMDYVFGHATTVVPGYLEECNDVLVHCSKAGNTAYVRFEYKGTIAGPDMLRKVVLPFNSTRDGGSGLDQMPIHTIVNAHGGRTFIRFEENETVMTIALPMIDSKKESSK